MKKTIIFAPNINNGGGFTLLRCFIERFLEGDVIYFLDIRTKNYFSKKINSDIVFWVSPNIISRLSAELQLRKMVLAGDLVVLFNGLPPLLKNKGKVIGFLQNSLYFSPIKLKIGSFKTSLRILCERLILQLFFFNVDIYIVQTKSMHEMLKTFAGKMSSKKIISIKKFSFYDDSSFPSNLSVDKNLKFDFVYVADGNQHKNHTKLLDAWRLLSEEGFFPSLALTVGASYVDLISEIEGLILKDRLNITNFGSLPQNEVFQLYKSSAALIYPSLSESLGLPLYEAGKFGLSIVAAELDYVRDSCLPEQTFDPNSALSIARAVKRFCGINNELDKISSVENFISFIDDI